jgi:hypothetical protein
MQVQLSQADIETIAAALHTVSPSGGGSPQFTLARRFSSLAGDKADDRVFARVLHFLRLVEAEVVEAELSDD